MKLKKTFLTIALIACASVALGAAGVGIYAWTALSGDIAAGDLIGITDVSDTSGSDNGTSKKITFTQLMSYVWADLAASDLPSTGTWDASGLTITFDSTNALDTDITYETLNTNTDVGTSAGQLAIGDHDHSGTYEPADATIIKSDESETITSPWYFAGLTTAKIDVVSLSSNTTATAQQVSGTYIIGTAAMTLTLLTAVEGYSTCFLSGQGSTAIIQVTPASGDYLVVDGVRGAVATAYASSGAAGDKICFFAADDTDWYVTSEVGTWSE